MSRIVDPRREVVAGVISLRVTALALAGIHGAYALLLLRYGAHLWDLPTYDNAKSVPGGITTWTVFALAASALLIVGTISKIEKLVGVGAFISAIWLSFFAIAFGMDAYDDPTPYALPGVVIYSGVAIIAATRASLAWRR